MKHISYTTRGVCSRRIDIEIDNNRIISVQFQGGCAGNTQGVAALTVGMTVEEVIERLEGIRCGFKTTSCPDQLAKALREYQQQQA